MADASVHLPSMLLNCTGGKNDFVVRGETLSEAIVDLFETYPLLKTHLYEQDGSQREHVNLFLNGENTRWFDSLDVPLSQDAQITIIQAVSGG